MSMLHLEIWMHEHLKVPSGEHPSKYGAKEVDNHFHFIWFTGCNIPESLYEIIIQLEEDINILNLFLNCFLYKMGMEERG